MSNITKLTIDPDQIFTKNIDLNLITKNINYSKNKYIKKFIDNNKHLEFDEKEKDAYINDLIENQHYDINFTGREIIRLHSIDKIKNDSYFRRILSACNDDAIINFIFDNNITIYLPELCLNSNDRAVEYLFNYLLNLFKKNYNPLVISHIPENKAYVSRDLFSLLSQNENDKIVDYLINNPNKININSFLLNNNPKAIQYCYNKY